MLSELQANGVETDEKRQQQAMAAEVPASPPTSSSERGRSAGKSAGCRQRPETEPSRLTRRRLLVDGDKDSDLNRRVAQLEGQAKADCAYFAQVRDFVNALQRKTEANEQNLKGFHEGFQKQFTEKHSALTKEIADLFGKFDGILEGSVKQLLTDHGTQRTRMRLTSAIPPQRPLYPRTKVREIPLSILRHLGG